MITRQKTTKNVHNTHHKYQNLY